MRVREAALWDYLTERQRIYHRRHVLRQPWPWTLDPILQKWRFPNVYRQLDTGTIYLREELLPQLEPGQILLNLVAYRHFNTVDLARRLLPLRGSLPENLHLFTEGIDAYTNAYRTSPFQNLGGLTQLENSQIASYTWRDQCPQWEKRLETMSMKDVMTALVNLPGIGRFVAYVIACDLTYTGLVDYSENSDVFPHTGSASCISWMHDVSEYQLDEIQLKLQLKHLHDKHLKELSERDFPWLTSESGANLQLTLRAIEDGCCELMRYRRLQSGQTFGRRFSRKVMSV